MTPQEREELEKRKRLLLRKRELLAQKEDLVSEGGSQSIPTARETVPMADDKQNVDNRGFGFEALPKTDSTFGKIGTLSGEVLNLVTGGNIDNINAAFDTVTGIKPKGQTFSDSKAQHRSNRHYGLYEKPMTEAEKARNKYYQDKLQEIPRGIMGPSFSDRAKERDIILERDGKSMTGPEAGLTRIVNSLALTVPQYLSEDWNKQVGAAGNEYPGISMAADIGGFLVPGTGAFNALGKGAAAIGRTIAPGVRSPTGKNILSRLGRWSPIVARDTAASVGDYALYEATVGTGTRAAQEGRQPTLQEAGQAALNAPTDPWAYIGGLASPINRTVRGVADVASGGRVSMTPKQRSKWANTVMQQNDARSKAFQMVAKRLKSDGITPEMLTQAVENYHYAGYSSVDEMLFEIAEAASSGKGGGQLKQLAVALGSVGGDAQQAARTNLRERRLTSLERMRDDLRIAAGLEGSDFYKYSDQLKEAERTLPDYVTPYAASIDDASWTEKVWPDLQTRPASQQAIIEAYAYARNRGQLEVASEISDLLPALGYRINETGNVVKLGSGKAGKAALDRARRNVPKKPSTQALDYIDRMLGDEAQKLRNPAAGGRRELAEGPADAQTSLRSIVDAETGLDQPRRVVHELKTAQQALDFGRKSSASGTDLETLQREFLREMRKYADDGVDVLGEETATINAALLMGWMRGAEDLISKASNPATAIRQLYGNERQREKLVQMLMGLDDTRLAQQFGTAPESIAKLSTGNSAETMRLRQVAGGKYGEKGTPRSRGRFDRERFMLDSENQIVGNSQSGQRIAAVEAQGGLQNRVNAFVNAAFDPRQAARKLTLNTVGRAFQRGIFNSAINRELGDIMFTGGRQQLNDIIGELQTHMQRRNALAPPSSGGSGGSMGSVAAAQANAPRPTPQAASSNGVSSKATDAAALGVASGTIVPAADAEGLNYEQKFAVVEQDLQRAQGERQATLQRLQSAQDELAAWNARFNAEDRNVINIQTFLRDNVNPKLAIDGDPRGQTATANQEYISRLEQAISTQQEALARSDALIQQVEARKEELENDQALNAAAPHPVWDFMRDKLFYPAAAAGIFFGGRARNARNRAAKQNALAIEDRVEGLLEPSGGRNALARDANNLNEVWQLGGASDNVPFQTTQTGPNAGQPRPKSKALQPSSLFPKGQFFDGGDLKSTATFGTEGALAHLGKRGAEVKVEEAEQRLEEAKASGNLGEIRDAARSLETWKTVYSLAEAFERLGLAGIATTGAYGAAGRYATPKPGIGKIGERQSSTLKRIEDRKSVAKSTNR